MNRKLVRALLRQAKQTHTPPEQYLLPLFEVLLRKQHKVIPGVSQSALAQQIETQLKNFSLQKEGTPNALTPEVLALFYEITRSGRKKNGIFYTPWPLAKLLAQKVLADWLDEEHMPCLQVSKLAPNKRRQVYAHLKNLKICDPAAGTGGLLLPFAVELALLLHRLNPAQSKGETLRFILENNLFGADLSCGALSVFCQRAQLLAAHYKTTLNTASLRAHFLCTDALAVYRNQSIWQIQFPAIFQTGGFDIILSNPPYVGQKGNKEIFENLRHNPLWGHYVTPKTDLLYFFFYLSFLLLKPKGLAGFITPPYFTTAAGAYGLRRWFQKEVTFTRLINFEDNLQFTDASPHTLLSVFHKGRANTVCLLGLIQPQKMPQEKLFQGKDLFLQTSLPNTHISTILTKLSAAPFTLKDKALISNGLMTGCDKISSAHQRSFPAENYTKGQGVFVLSTAEKNALQLPVSEEKKLKPFFKNSAITPYTAAQTPVCYLIDFFYPNDRQTDFTKYPHLLTHLTRFKKVLLARKQNNNGIQKQLAKGHFWFGSVRRRMNFEGEKLVSPQRAARPTFAYTNGAWYASSDVYFISSKEVSLWYLLAILNSRVIWLWLFYKGKRKGNLLELYSQPLSCIPLPAATAAEQQKLAQLARHIYQLKRKNSTADIATLQSQIDRLSAQIYTLNKAEINTLLAWQPN